LRTFDWRFMNCISFQDSISDYLDDSLETRTRAEFAAHRLRCTECRSLFGDVRTTVGVLSGLARESVEESESLADRILAATTAGEMLSCSAFDDLIERYFDGVILAPTFQTFQAHFAQCNKCRRLLGGIEEAISICHEVKTDEVEIPETLYDRIVAATSGADAGKETYVHRWRRRVTDAAGHLWTPQIAAAALIFAASGLLITSRFGSVGAAASHAGAHAERIVTEGQAAINQTGTIAITGMQRVSDSVNNMFQDKPGSKPGNSIDNRQQPTNHPQAQPSPASSVEPSRPPEPPEERKSCLSTVSDQA
jgi:predicted anti-sigma-YlaC factor YlaD